MILPYCKLNICMLKVCNAWNGGVGGGAVFQFKSESKQIAILCEI
jgi:hypothetical protein